MPKAPRPAGKSRQAGAGAPRGPWLPCRHLTCRQPRSQGARAAFNDFANRRRHERTIRHHFCNPAVCAFCQRHPASRPRAGSYGHSRQRAAVSADDVAKAAAAFACEALGVAAEAVPASAARSSTDAGGSGAGSGSGDDSDDGLGSRAALAAVTALLPHSLPATGELAPAGAIGALAQPLLERTAYQPLSGGASRGTADTNKGRDLPLPRAASFVLREHFKSAVCEERGGTEWDSRLGAFVSSVVKRIAAPSGRPRTFEPWMRCAADAVCIRWQSAPGFCQITQAELAATAGVYVSLTTVDTNALQTLVGEQQGARDAARVATQVRGLSGPGWGAASESAAAAAAPDRPATSCLPHGMDVPLRYPHVLLRRDLADILHALFVVARFRVLAADAVHARAGADRAPLLAVLFRALQSQLTFLMRLVRKNQRGPVLDCLPADAMVPLEVGHWVPQAEGSDGHQQGQDQQLQAQPQEE